MKVMVLGGDQLQNFGARYYGYANKLSNGFIRNNHTVVRFYDRDVSRINNIFRSRTFGIKKANDEFLRQTSLFKPDLILSIHADVIKPIILEQVKEILPATKIAIISVDALFSPDNVSRLKAKSHMVNATFLTTAGEGLKKISGGRPAYYIPNITDPSMETGRAFDSNCINDLIFACGSFEKGGNDPREKTLDVISERLFHINFLCHVAADSGGLWGSSYMEELAQSKCGLNLSREREGSLDFATPEEMHVYSSDRIAQLTGNGVLTFSHKKFNLDKIFTEDEMVFYDSNDDLIDKISHFLENDVERRRIAKNGWKKAHQHLNERLVAQYIIDVLFYEDFSHDYVWPTEQII